MVYFDEGIQKDSWNSTLAMDDCLRGYSPD